MGNNILAESGGEGDDGGEPWLPGGFEFLSGLSSAERKRRIILTVQQTYLDDSGVKGTHPIFTYAGFMGRADAWAAFSDKWKDWLDATPRIAYLKMNEAVKLTGQFRGFTEAERDEKLRKGIAILRKYPQKAIQMSVDTEAYEIHLAPHTPRSLRNPFFLAFFGILSAACWEAIDTGVPEQIEIFFDEQSIFRPRVEMWYPWIRDSIGEIHDPALARVLPPNPIFRDDKEYRPLQAADVLAWLFRNAWSGLRNKFEWIAEETSAGNSDVAVRRCVYSPAYAGR